MLSDHLAARVRTVWPYVLAWLAATLLVHGAPVADWLHSALGLEVTAPQVAAGLGVALGYAIYEAGRWLESREGEGRWPLLARWVGRLLLSLGFDTGQPTYGQPPAETESVATYDSAGNLAEIRSVTTYPRRE